jgi:predicted nuclease of restriction endonuclease-like (RecB) superfamily
VNVTDSYNRLLGSVSALLEAARRASVRSVNIILTATYWEIGRRIVEFELEGKHRAEYGKRLLERLARDLLARFGRGFGYSNLNLMRQFYITYADRRPNLQSVTGESLSPVFQAVVEESSPSAVAPVGQSSHKDFVLSWTHYVRLLPLGDQAKRDFYEEETLRAGWSVRQLDRQINSMLYERLALSRQKGELLREAEQSKETTTPEEAIKDPYILEFLGLPESYSEKDLESSLIRHLADFLLELGYGFTFVARQKRLQIGSESYYLDLLFYHRPLRCLVAIDLKVGKFTHADAGQMNLYLNYLRENETLEDETSPIGLILCSEKDEAVAHYALGGLSNKVFASRYELQLPDPDLLRHEIEAERRRLEARTVVEEQRGKTDG